MIRGRVIITKTAVLDYSNSGETQMDNKIVLIIIAILLPPLAVFLKKGAGKDLVINIVLTLLLYIPGAAHAIWLIVK